MAKDDWHDFVEGAALGQPGSEQGVVVRDEEHALGARITLERAASVAPFAITCGIYGWMLHTRYFDEQAEAEAQYEAMKKSLDELLDAAEKSADGGRGVLFEGVSRFVERYP